MNDAFVILPVSEITNAIIVDCYELINTYRKSLDGTQAVLHYRGTPPSWTNGLTLLSLGDAQALMQTSAWSLPSSLP
jgi:hypothetical protein